MTPDAGDGRAAPDEIRILDVGAFLLRQWKTLAAGALLGVAVAAVVVVLGPSKYTARTVVVPSPSREPQAGLMASQLPVGLLGLGGGGNSNDQVIAAILKSRTLEDSIVSSVREAVGQEHDPELIRTILQRNTNVTNSEDGSVIVEVTSRDPALAAAIANAYPGIINEIAARLSEEAAGRKQAFLEGQLIRAREQLLKSEQSLVEFQLGTEAPLLQEQAQQTVVAAAALQQSIIEKEVAVMQLRRTSTAGNPNLRAAEAELAALRSQLRRLTAGQGGSDQVFLSFRESPELSVASARLVRQFTTDEQVYLSLTSALVQSQIDVQDKLPVVSVLDKATVPRSPSRLPLTFVLTAAALFGLLFGLIFAIVNQYLRTARLDPANRSFFAAWESLKQDVIRFVPGRRSGGRPPRKLNANEGIAE
jgi:uncharacterized protein involved in exopolysaccharide biosynthesis